MNWRGVIVRVGDIIGSNLSSRFRLCEYVVPST
jgi:hypothetical protein